MVEEVLALIFPGGKRLQNTIPATAGNVTYNASPAPNKRWLIVRGQIILVCDATVTNRIITLQLTDGINITEQIGYTTAITASVTAKLDIGEAIVARGISLGNDFYVGLQNCILEGADQFRILVQSGVAGDSYSGFLVVREI